MSNQSRALLIVSVLLFLSIAGHFVTWRINSTNELEAKLKNIELLNENAVHKAAGDSAKAKVERLASKIDSERASFKVALSKAEAEIKRHKSNSTATRPKIQVMVDSIPDLRDFVAFQDSTIASQDTLIISLKLRHAAEIIDLNQVVKLQAQQITTNMAIGENWRQMAEAAQKAERKQTKAKKVWRFIAGVGAAGVGILLLKP
jgi:hypothetical protein